MYTRREVTRGLAAAGISLSLGPARRWDVALVGSEDDRVRGVPVAHRHFSIDLLPRLRADMERITERGGVSDNPIFRSYLEGRRYEPPEALPQARSVVIVALADRRYEVGVRVEGRRLPVPIPPGYTADEITSDDIQSFVRRRVLHDSNARLEPANLPLKLVAARTGLAEYGRNNLAYVRGMGSFHSLRAYFSDQPCPATAWHSVRQLHYCKGCSICMMECPTKAIRKGRFVIDAGRCVTLYNERPNPMPTWMPSRAHNALVGCTRCQWKCPANASSMGRHEILAELTEAETAMLLSGDTSKVLETSIATKMKRNGLSGDLTHLARNLRLVVAAAVRAASTG